MLPNWKPNPGFLSTTVEGEFDPLKLNERSYGCPDVVPSPRISEFESCRARRGWVEPQARLRASSTHYGETHHGHFSAAYPLMGFASLNPSYSTCRTARPMP